jgi:hypothetical protein
MRGFTAAFTVGAMAYEIKSYMGAGRLVFGMSPKQVHELLGKPRFSRRDASRLREIYRVCPALTFVGTDGQLKLVEIGFAKAAGEVIYGGANLFAGEQMAVVQRLCGEDPNPREVIGMLVFPKLGISLTGFHTGPKESIAVTAFAPGRWDAQLARSKPFKFSKSMPLIAEISPLPRKK